MELKKGQDKPPSPFKFNKVWLNDDSFVELVKSIWVPYNSRDPWSASFQFIKNIKRLKMLIKAWARSKRVREEHELKQIEEAMACIYEEEGGGLLTKRSKENLIGLKGDGTPFYWKRRKPRG